MGVVVVFGRGGIVAYKSDRLFWVSWLKHKFVDAFLFFGV